MHTNEPMKRYRRATTCWRGMAALLCLATMPALALRPETSIHVKSSAPLQQPVRQANAMQRTSAQSAAACAVEIDWDAALGTPAVVRGKDLGARQAFSAGKGLALVAGSPADNAIAVMDNLSGIFGIRDAQREFAAKATSADGLGFHHVRLDQRYEGLRVFGGDLVVHFNQRGQCYHVNGRYVPDIALTPAPVLSADEAERQARMHLAESGIATASREQAPVLVVFAFNTAPHLAYEMVFRVAHGTNGLALLRYFISATDGSVVFVYNNLKTITPPTGSGTPSTMTGNVLAGEGGNSTNVTGWFETSNSSYYLYNAGLYCYVYNVAGSGYPDANTYAYRAAADWGTTDRAEMSLAIAFDTIQRYFLDVHGRKSFDDNNVFARANVHEGYSYVNAFWDGGDFHFGDGDNYSASSLAVLDIAGHEYGHAVDEYSANLTYAYEPGALNESFSDIFGTCIEFYGQPDGRASYPNATHGYADWLCGEDAWMETIALRDLRNPANTVTVGAGNQQPTRYRGTYWYYGSADNGGVHYNSGVQNFMFYLLAEGGSGINDGAGYSVTGIGITNAARVAYRALTVYCTASTDHSGARLAWIAAANDLDPAWVSSVRAAWAAVGVTSFGISPIGSVVFSGSQGGPFSPAAFSFDITNKDATAMAQWSVTSPVSWLTFSQESGTLPPNGGTRVSVALTAEAQAMPQGTFPASLMFTNATEGSVELRTVTLQVMPPPIYSFPMDTNPGWTMQEQWQFGRPQGQSGDPTLGFTGTNVCGYNLLGSYANSIPVYYLTTTALDFRDYDQIILTFQRWLGVEEAYYDHASVQLSTNGTSWVTLWNHTGITIIDTQWQSMSFDISSFAAQQPTVFVRWGMGPTDSIITYGGWNVDDVMFYGTVHDVLRVSPTGGWNSVGFYGGPFTPSNAVYTVANIGISNLDWTVSSPATWLEFVPAGGMLSSGAVDTFTAVLKSQASTLAPGIYSTSLIVSNRNTGVYSIRPVSLRVDDILRVTPDVVVTSLVHVGGLATPSNIIYTLYNGASQSITWSANQDAAWLSASPRNGLLEPGATAMVSVAISATAGGFAQGSYTGTVRFGNALNGAVHARGIVLRVLPIYIHAFPLDSDPGWLMEGQWQFGQPLGKGGLQQGKHDPIAGASGTNVFGVNLNGDYNSTLVGGPWYITVGPLDFSLYTNVSVQYQRWLNTYEQDYAQAMVDVSSNGIAWTRLWANSTVPIAESSWQTLSHDIHTFADQQRSLYVRWGYAVVKGAPLYAYSGWNIDDVVFIGARIYTPYIAITTPASIVVPYSIRSVDIAGPCWNIVAPMWWSNSLVAGASPIVPGTEGFAATIDRLVVGNNGITVFGTNIYGARTNAAISITRGGLGTDPPFIDITNTPVTVMVEVTCWSIGGSNNEHVVHALWWTNSLTGAGGAFGVAPGWTISNIALGAGINVIRVFGSNGCDVVTSDSVAIRRLPFMSWMSNGLWRIKYAKTSSTLEGINVIPALELLFSNRWMIGLGEFQSGVFSNYSGPLAMTMKNKKGTAWQRKPPAKAPKDAQISYNVTKKGNKLVYKLWGVIPHTNTLYISPLSGEVPTAKGDTNSWLQFMLTPVPGSNTTGWQRLVPVVIEPMDAKQFNRESTRTDANEDPPL